MGLVWWGHEECAVCGAVCEFDDYGDLPKNLKAQVIAEEGEWKLVIALGQHRGPALRVLRNMTQIDLNRCQALLDNLRGTKTTLRWLKQGFDGAGVGSVLVRID